MTNNKRRRLAKDAARSARAGVLPFADQRGNRKTRRNRQFGRDRARLVAQRGTLDQVAAQQAEINGPEVMALIADAAEASEVFGDDVLEQAQRDAAVAAALAARPKRVRKAK